MQLRRIQLRWDRTTMLTSIGIGLVVALFAGFAYSRRWISDDGLIVVRTVRNLLDGNGPVFNAFERAESNTSTLWTYVVALATWVSRQGPNVVAVATGWLLSVGGLIVAIDGTRRWYRARGSTAVLVPASVWVVVVAQPYWDFATSGLETGLCMFWLAACWWLLVALREDRANQLRAVIVFGLGPLVRPDFALLSIVFCTGGWLITRPPWRRTLALVGAGVALPFAYEIFRAGYYGMLVPLPALAKGASDAKWGTGFDYVTNWVHPYVLWVPFVVLAPVLAIAIKKRAVATRDRILVGTVVTGALLLTLFIVRVGGDFMHGRMMLAPTFLLLLPALVLPLRRWTVPSLALVLVWAAFAFVRVRHHVNTTSEFVNDERLGYVIWTHSKHPIASHLFVTADKPSSQMAIDAMKAGRRSVVSEGGIEIPANPAYNVPVIFIAGRLGTGGVIAPLDGMVIDAMGLANPLGARITPTQPGIIGHEKSLPWGWIRAEFTDPAVDRKPYEGTPLVRIEAARRALQCGELKELMESVRAPMTAGRFWTNLTGAFRRTRLVIPSDPIEAEWKFCGKGVVGTKATASSSYESDGWALLNAVDGVRETDPLSLGYSSMPGQPQWLELQLTTKRRISKVTLYPRTQPAAGIGFPIDFQIQVWDGQQWVDRAKLTEYPRPTGPAVFSWATPDLTDRVRILTTKLPDDGDGPRLQFAEVEVE